MTPRARQAAVAMPLLLAAGATAFAGAGAHLVFAAAVILIIGLPHGASDHLVVPPRRLPLFLVVYLGALAAMIALWLAEPALGLGLFLLLSAVHFGVDDLPPPATAHIAERVLRGLMPVTLPGLFHTARLGDFYGALADPATGHLFAQTAFWMSIPVTVATVLMVGMGRRADLAFIMGVLIVFPPLIGFSLYFALIHSSGQTRERMSDLGIPSLPRYLRATAPTLAGAGLLFALLAGMGAARGWSDLSPLFIGIGALTVPHMLITPMFRREHDGLRLR